MRVAGTLLALSKREDPPPFRLALESPFPAKQKLFSTFEPVNASTLITVNDSYRDDSIPHTLFPGIGSTRD